MKLFESGPTVNIEDLTEDEAVLIFGRPLYEAWKKAQSEPASKEPMVVTKVCTKTNTITIGRCK